MSLQPPPIKQAPISKTGRFTDHWVLWFNKIKELNQEGNLSIAGDTGTDTVDLVADTLSFSGTSDEIVTTVTDSTVTIAVSSTLTGDISTNTANIATNTAGIATNVTNIATNVTNIATNVTNIATNTASIAALDLDFAGDSGTGAVTNAQVLTIAGTTNEIETSASSQTLTIGLPSVVAITTSLNVGSTIAMVGTLDDDTFGTATNTTWATSESIKAYVDTQLTAEALGIAGDSGTGTVDLDSQSLTIAGTANEIETVASGQALTVGLPSTVHITTALGIGTTSPTDLLSLGFANAGTGVMEFRSVQYSRLAQIKGVDLDNGGGGELQFWTRNTGTPFQRMTIDDSGNVGIGTSTPTSGFLLDVAGNTKVQSVITNRTSVGGVEGSVADENSFEAGPGYLNLYRDSTAGVKQIQFGKNGALHSFIETNTLGFNIGASGGADLTISPTGDVGIGTLTPGSKVDAITTTSGSLAGRFENSHATNSFGVVIEAGSDSSNYSFDARDKDGNFLMRVRGDGNVGIGTTSPSSTLDVHGRINIHTTAGAGDENRFEFIQGGAGDPAIQRMYNASETLAIEVNAGGSTYFNGGDFGIGTISPALPLDVVSETVATNTDVIVAGFHHNTSGTAGDGIACTIQLGVENSAGADRSSNLTYELEDVTGATEDGLFTISTHLAGTKAVRFAIQGENMGLGGISNPGNLLSLYKNNTSTAPSILIEQDGTGDASLLYTLTGGESFATGIDNTDDSYKISKSTALGTNDYVEVDTNGKTTVTGLAIPRFPDSSPPAITTTEVWMETTNNFLFVYNGTDWSYYAQAGTQAL